MIKHFCGTRKIPYWWDICRLTATMHLLMLMYLLSTVYGRHGGCSLVVTMVHDRKLHYFCTPQKASVGMYSRCLSLTNLVCVLFDPIIPTSSFNFIVLYMYTTKNIFQSDNFLYSPCPNLEGIKDALSYKFRRLMIGQNKIVVPCARTRLPGCRGHRDARASDTSVSTGLLGTPPSLKRSERRCLLYVMVWW